MVLCRGEVKREQNGIHNVQEGARRRRLVVGRLGSGGARPLDLAVR
jgi:hypothetical protein